MNIITSDKNKPYNAHIVETLDIIENYNVKGIATVILTEDGGGLTAYWNMGVYDKGAAEMHIRSDFIDQLVQSNIQKYLDSL